MSKNTILKVKNTEYKELLSVWESSVQATHDFLKIQDFEFYKKLIPTFFEHVVLYCVKNKEDKIVGFSGTQEENLEVLFVAENEIGKGIGRDLLLHAIHHLNATKVDVNKDNLKAFEFYKHYGFELVNVSDLDGFGKPYPILHLELKNIADK